MNSMGRILSDNLGCARVSFFGKNRSLRRVAALGCLLVLACTGCKKIRYVDTKPLDQAGMDYSAIQEMKTLDPTDAEIAEVAKAKMGGLSDKTSIELLRIARSQKQPADFADAADNLVQVGMTEDNILQLARMHQLGVPSGELQAMKLTGVSDPVVMEIARRHYAGEQALSGVSLAHLKDAGFSQAALLEMVRRGVRDDQVAAIISMRRQRMSEAEIMKRIPAADVTPLDNSGISQSTQ